MTCCIQFHISICRYIQVSAQYNGYIHKKRKKEKLCGLIGSHMCITSMLVRAQNNFYDTSKSRIYLVSGGEEHWLRSNLSNFQMIFRCLSILCISEMEAQGKQKLCTRSTHWASLQWPSSQSLPTESAVI